MPPPSCWLSFQNADDLIQLVIDLFQIVDTLLLVLYKFLPAVVSRGYGRQLFFNHVAMINKDSYYI